MLFARVKDLTFPSCGHYLQIKGNLIMSTRRSLRLPITLGVVMIVLIVAIIVGWVLVNVFAALKEETSAPLYWTLLSVGSVSLVAVLVGVVMYLVLSITAINLNRRQSNFMDSVTHELKSPIASLKLYLQTLTLREVNDEERENFHRFMLDDVERLDNLINHLLDAARLEREAVDSEIEDVDIAELVAQCAQSVCLRYRVPNETISLKTEPCIVRGRHVDLDMIFRNLIDNAVKYAGSPPRVEVSLNPKSDEEIVVTVADNGQGIPLQMRRKIFGRFVRLGFELEREKPGTGLGLYIVRTLVSRLRGRIRVRDPDDGPGTVFEVQLPGTSPKKKEAKSDPPRPIQQAEVA